MMASIVALPTLLVCLASGNPREQLARVHMNFASQTPQPTTRFSPREAGAAELVFHPGRMPPDVQWQWMTVRR